MGVSTPGKNEKQPRRNEEREGFLLFPLRFLGLFAVIFRGS
jgi:hypothetical protein